MNEPVKPVDLEAIRKNTADYCDNYVVLSPGLKQALNIDIPALCDEVEALRERVKEYEAVCTKFAKAWAEWHEHSGSDWDDDLINAGHEIVESLGLEWSRMKKQESKTL